MSKTFSDIKVTPVNFPNSKLVARGTVVIQETVKVKFSVIEGTNGKFVALPQEKGNKPGPDGKDQYFPIVSLASKELSEELNKLVLAELGGNSNKPTKTQKALPF